MYLKMKTGPSTGNFCRETAQLKEAAAEAGAVVIGAGAGLSASAGFTYEGERFHRYFADFEEKYGFHDMYAGGFYPYPAPEEYWAYWSRHIAINRYADAPKPLYGQLLELVKDKDYFVITTNVDHCFQKAGFDKKRLFYTQGDYGLFQCSGPCRPKTFDNEKVIGDMWMQQEDMRIPSALLPFCPYCGRPMAMNLRADEKFVEDEGWHAAAGRYGAFLRRHRGGRLLFLELGVGYNTPGIIKYPFWQMAAENPQAVYACINRGQAACPKAAGERTICIDGDIGEILQALKA